MKAKSICVGRKAGLFALQKGATLRHRVGLLILLSMIVLPSAFAAPLSVDSEAGGGSGDGNLAVHSSLIIPYGVAVDASGNVFASDWEGNASMNPPSNRIRRIDAVTGAMTTYAGSGGYGGYSGDGGQANLAKLNFPGALLFDDDGSLYFSDQYNHRVRKISPDGIITTVAGNGSISAYTGDGGPAVAASLSGPGGLAFDSEGNLLVANRGFHRINKIDKSGIITTVAGTGERGFSGDGGPAIGAKLDLPWGVAVDSVNNVYFADFRNFRIRRVDGNGVITTVAGDGFYTEDSWGGRAGRFLGEGVPAVEASLNYPIGIAVATDGSFFIADYRNHRVRKVDSAGIITTFAGSNTSTPFTHGRRNDPGDGILATESTLLLPTALALTGDEEVLIADGWNSRIRKVGSDGVIRSVAGTGEWGFLGEGTKAKDARVWFPEDVSALPDGSLLLADGLNGRIRRINSDGTIQTVAGDGRNRDAGDGGPAREASFRFAESVASDASGNIYVADRSAHRVRKISPDGIISAFAGSGTAGFSGDGGLAVEARLNSPEGITVAADGSVFIADADNNRIRKVDAFGTISTIAGSGSGGWEYGFAGDGGPATSAKLNRPSDVAVHPDGSLYIADSRNDRVRKVNADGTIVTIAGGGPLCCGFANAGPATAINLGEVEGIALDASGNLFITDYGYESYEGKLRRVDSAGTMITFVGNDFFNWEVLLGNTAPGPMLSFDWPKGVTVASDGVVYVADSYGQRIMSVTPLEE